MAAEAFPMPERGELLFKRQVQTFERTTFGEPLCSPLQHKRERSVVQSFALLVQQTVRMQNRTNIIRTSLPSQLCLATFSRCKAVAGAATLRATPGLQATIMGFPVSRRHPSWSCDVLYPLRTSCTTVKLNMIMGRGRCTLYVSYTLAPIFFSQSMHVIHMTW